MPMTLEEKRLILQEAQKRIDSMPYSPTIPYVYCCICFERLTEHNILEKEDGLWDYCIPCHVKEEIKGKNK